MANRASKVVNGTAAEEPSDHRTRFNRKKIPNINLESKKKLLHSTRVIVMATILKMTITLTVMKTTIKIMIKMITKIIEMMMMTMKKKVNSFFFDAFLL